MEFLSEQPTYGFGDPVEYLCEPVFDGIIDTGERGSFIELRDGWVLARWPAEPRLRVPRCWPIPRPAGSSPPPTARPMPCGLFLRTSRPPWRPAS
jgi:hypothetical protein